jgi:hypothetical protein
MNQRQSQVPQFQLHLHWHGHSLSPTIIITTSHTVYSSLTATNYNGTYSPSHTSAKSGYLRSACSSRCAIHALRNALPLRHMLATNLLDLDTHHTTTTHLLIVSESPITHRCRLGRVMPTFSRRLSPKNPTSPELLLRTVLSTTASFSRP